MDKPTFPERPRPEKLSNEGCCHSDDELRAIDRKPLNELTPEDFQVIFTIAGCTAKYSERLFYLPLALGYAQENPDEYSPHLVEVVHFLSDDASQLAQDEFLEPALAALRGIFKKWTAEFRIVHYDAAACKAEGSLGDHRDVVEGSWDVREVIDALLTYETHAAVAEELVEEWARPSRTEIDSAWLLELANEERISYRYHEQRDPPTPPDLDDATKLSGRIQALIMDDALLQSEYDRIKNSALVRESGSPTYWPDLLASLQLRA